MPITPHTLAMLQARVSGVSGLKKRKKIRTCPTEDQEQITFIQWVREYEGMFPDFKLLCHIPNGGSRNILEAMKLKKMGVRPGMPDLFLPIGKKHYYGWFCELKAKDGKLTAVQTEMLRVLLAENYFTVAAYGWEQARDSLLWYVRNK